MDLFENVYDSPFIGESTEQNEVARISLLFGKVLVLPKSDQVAGNFALSAERNALLNGSTGLSGLRCNWT